MAGTGLDQLFKLPRGQVEECALQCANQRCRPLPVLRVLVFVLSAAIVQEGKQFDDLRVSTGFLCQLQSIRTDTRPMPDTVDTLPVEAKVRLKKIEQGSRYGSLGMGHGKIKSRRWQDGLISKVITRVPFGPSSQSRTNRFWLINGLT
jgi:hypothetical protein